MTTPLIDQPDWPDRSQWERKAFGAQVLHDKDMPVRRFETWNDAELHDLVQQVADGVSFEEIARRHQRHEDSVRGIYRLQMKRLEERLLR